MAELEWADPPPGKGARYAVPRKHHETAAQLKAKPGLWARVLVSDRDRAMRIAAHQIKNGQLAAYRPARAFEAVSRKVGDEFHVFARYVGEKTDE